MLPDADAQTEPENTKKVEFRPKVSEQKESWMKREKSSSPLTVFVSLLAPFLLRSLEAAKFSSAHSPPAKNGGKKSCKETREDKKKEKKKKKKKNTTPREKMSNPYLFVRDRWLENVEASQERKKERRRRRWWEKAGEVMECVLQKHRIR